MTNTNKLREAANLKRAAKAHAKRTYSTIIKELGDTTLTLDDLIDPAQKTKPGLLAILDKSGATLDELVVLQQYSKAILQSDTKSAEFLRDSSGQKPSQVIDLNQNQTSGLSQMTLEELESLSRDLHKLVDKKG